MATITVGVATPSIGIIFGAVAIALAFGLLLHLRAVEQAQQIEE